jgi:hypothetical protein
MQVDTAEGIRNFDEILQGADGVMVCRGQLGVVIPPQKVCQVTWCRVPVHAQTLACMAMPSHAMVWWDSKHNLLVQIVLPFRA